MFSYLIEHRRGIIGTLLIHGVLIAVFILFGFSSRQVPTEEGLLINFGTTDEGSGIIEPAMNTSMPQSSSQDASPAAPAETDKEEILTQPFEETAAVETAKKVPVVKQKSAEEIEAERQRLLEAERQKQLELERQRKEEEQRRIAEINSRVKNAFASGKNAQENTSTGEGTTGGTGNQGKVDGSVDSPVHGEGSGLGQEGIGFTLEGRTPQTLTRPEYKSQKEGRVVVEITVDRNGTVTQAIPGIKGSSTLDEYLLSVARKAALSSKFDKKPDAPAFQKGTITYNFILE